MIQITVAGDTLDDVFAKMKAMLKAPTTPAEMPKGEMPRDDFDGTPAVEEASKRGRKSAKAAEAPTPEPKNETTTAISIDEVRKRVQAITDNAQTRGEDIPSAIALAKDLFGKFGIKKISELAADKYEEFMSVSKSYLEGKKA